MRHLSSNPVGFSEAPDRGPPPGETPVGRLLDPRGVRCWFCRPSAEAEIAIGHVRGKSVPMLEGRRRDFYMPYCADCEPAAQEWLRDNQAATK